LLACLEQAKCWSAVHDPNIGGMMDAEEFLELCKAAGYSEEAAQKAATERANKRMDKDLTP
jgi:hypothetical protein